MGSACEYLGESAVIGLGLGNSDATTVMLLTFRRRRWSVQAVVKPMTPDPTMMTSCDELIDAILVSKLLKQDTSKRFV